MEQLEKVVKLCIHMGTPPKEVYRTVFNIIDKEIDFGEVKYVLYCKSFGGYGYSDEFSQFLHQHYNNNNNDESDTDSDREIYSYIILFAQSLNVSINEALKKASGDYCKLAVQIVPKHRKYTIHEYDGAESVQILKDFV
jgi:hypothetical protein